jgi:hypothetical protein
MKRLAAGLITVALMGWLLWSGSRRPAGDGTASVRTGESPDPIPASAPAPASPAEARVQSLLDEARRGDVDSYLGGFAGPLRQRLEREAGERGRAAFADDLRAAARLRKSHAVFAAEPDGPDAARVTVEAVYPDRNERQTYRVERDGPTGAWLVTGVETVRSHQPKAKYGSPAAFIAPEGNPVQGAGVTVETGDEPGGAGP